MHRTHPTVATVCICAIVLSACGGTSVFDPVSDVSGDPDPRGVYERCPTAGDSDSGAFEKPEVDRKIYRQFQDDPPRTSLDLRTNTRLWSREYMPEPEGANTVWLNHGEYFSLDGALILGGTNAPEKVDVRMLAFVDFEPVPFEVAKVRKPGGWTPRDRFSTLEFDESQRETLRADAPFNFTLVIPPESLGDRGVHDIRIVILVEHRPNPDKPFLQFRAPFSKQAYTLFYGGNEVVNPVDTSFPSLERTQTSSGFGFHLASKFDGVFLYPEAHASRYTDRSYPADKMELGGVLSSSTNRIKLEATVQKSTPFDYAGENYYVVLKDGEPVPGLAGTGVTGGSDSMSGEMANRMPIPIDLEDQKTHSVRLLSFPAPHCNWLETRKPAEGRMSNTLFVRRVD